MALESDLAKYPGMFAPEQEVWRAWLLKNQSYYDRFEYNVRVGPGEDPGPAYPEEIRRMAILNSQPRIDVVAYSVRGREIIEVKVRAQNEVIGQIASYMHLYPSSFPGSYVLTARIVCNEYPIYLAQTARNWGISIDAVGITLSADAGSF